MSEPTLNVLAYVRTNASTTASGRMELEAQRASIVETLNIEFGDPGYDLLVHEETGHLSHTLQIEVLEKIRMILMSEFFDVFIVADFTAIAHDESLLPFISHMIDGCGTELMVAG